MDILTHGKRNGPNHAVIFRNGPNQAVIVNNSRYSFLFGRPRASFWYERFCNVVPRQLMSDMSVIPGLQSLQFLLKKIEDNSDRFLMTDKSLHLETEFLPISMVGRTKFSCGTGPS